MWGSKNDQPKGLVESTEDEDMVEINRLYDSEKSFGRTGDKNASLIQRHHKDKAISAYMDKNPGEMAAWDEKTDRYYQYDGRKLR
jgi:hypothetical protein